MSVSGWQAFVKHAPQGAEQAMRNLAVAESLTDAVAQKLYELAAVDHLAPAAFVEALHYCDFIQPRNSEWHIEPEVRRLLLAADGEQQADAHALLLSIADSADPALAREIVPGYLFSDGGLAYHLAGAGRVDEALSLYSRAAHAPAGEQWLAGQLAEEQEARGVLPENSTETLFLRAMILFREHRKSEARPLFEYIAGRDEVRIETAISMHILANMISPDDAVRPEKLYRRSISIREDLNERYGIAKVMHSLAKHLTRHRTPGGEAERLLRESWKILENEGRPGDVGQVLHTLANVIAKDRKRIAADPARFKEAEDLYRESVKRGRETEDVRGLAQRLHSLGKFLAEKTPPDPEAEDLFLESIELDERLNNLRGVAQTEHDFGRYLISIPHRSQEAEGRLRRSLELISADNHQAQVKLTLARLVERRSPADAEALIKDSLSADERAGNDWGARKVRRALADFYSRHPERKR